MAKPKKDRSEKYRTKDKGKKEAVSIFSGDNPLQGNSQDDHPIGKKEKKRPKTNSG